MKVNDLVITKAPLWHMGEDIGDRLAIIVEINAYYIIDVYEYTRNPVKCFRNEIERIEPPQDDDIEFDIIGDGDEV